jgi:hypothetical protein
MSPGILYTLTVNNVRDRASTPNVIAPNTQCAFTLDFTPLDISNLAPNREAIGPSSRCTGLVISEVMYHPTNRADGAVLQFIELYNSQVFAEDLSGYRLSGALSFTFPTNTLLPAGGRLVVAPVPADVQSAYGITGVLGGFPDRLAKDAGTIRLRNPAGAVLLEAHYSDAPPWPVAADGAGHSLVLARPSFGEANPEAWEASDLVGGTPGWGETPAPNPYRAIVINEFLAHTDDPEVDYVELYNYSTQSVNLAGCILSDHPVTNRFVLPNVTIPGRGFVVFNQSQLGFALSAAGETIYLKNPSGTKVIDAVRFEGQQNGVATGRYPDGAPGFYRLASPTPGSSNGKILVSDVVLNEIMYDPISGSSQDEYVELYNRGTNSIALAGWKLSDAVSFTFPSNAFIPAGGYVVVANKAARLMTNYAGLNPNNTFGDYSGNLPNGGARIALTMPDELVSTNAGVRVTNAIDITVDEVSYQSGGRWGQWAHQGGSSLELMDPHSDHRLAANWADSDESDKSAWTTIEYTGVLDNGSGSADSLQILLQDAGECLVDNVEVFAAGGANCVPNPDFESSFDGWFARGTHDQSYWQASGGYGGGKCLHLVAGGRGDTGANGVRTALTSALSAGATATLRAKVRWLKGNPEILLRLHGNWLEAYGNILTARNLGTPGGPNSRAALNAGPAIAQVSHRPLLPAAGQPVIVCAQVSDPDGLASLSLQYRLDPDTNFTAVSMSYNGAGVYSATIPGQAAGTLVAFHLRATDNAAPAVTTLFPREAPGRECLVRFGEGLPNTGRVGTYRFWITQATNQRWTSRQRNSNEPLDATFVYNDSRVVYNIGALYSGSPWHTPGYNGPLNNMCDYVLVFPQDDRLLGATDFVLASLGNGDNDNTGQREQAAFWMLEQLGVPTLYRRYINLFVNGLQRGLVFEDAQQPSADLVAEWFPDDQDGDLHKIDDWFEFDNTGDNMLFNVDATLQNFTTTGGAKKLARYRWNWRKRAVKNSANYYTNLFGLVDAVNAAPPEPFTSLVERLIDYEAWTRVVAVEHIVGNWDSYGYNRGKNMYAYKPTNGKWALMAFDIDFLMDNGGDGYTTDLSPPTMPINDPTIRTLLSFPPVQRAFWRALQDSVNGPLAPANISAMMNAKYLGLWGAGIPVASPSGPVSWVASRRAYIQSLLANVSAPFALTSNAGRNFSTNRNCLSLSGTAPINVKTITLNGLVYPVTWTSVSNWTALVALNGGANLLTVSGQDLAGNPLPNATASITITYTGPVELPQNRLVINEIMYNPVLPNASFIEIYNAATNNAFDLCGCRLHGADFTFGPGSVIQPGGFLVIANDANAFCAAYGAAIPIAGVFDGKLDNGGETLTLLKPGATPDQDLLLDQVTYGSAPPWPGAANGFGPSLQLIDPAQDHNRVANWAAVTTNSVPAPQWQYVAVSGTASSSRLYLYLGSAGDVYVDDLKLVAGLAPEVGQNYVQNGDFESALTGPWQTTANTAASALSTSVKRSGNASLHLVCQAGGTTVSDCLWQDLSPLVNGNPYTLSFWFLQQTNAGILTVRLSGSGVRVDQNLQMQGGSSLTQYTPGAPNSVRANLSPFPLVWLNEIQPNNLSGPRDNFGERDPWVELYNAGATTADLTGYYLSDNYTNLLQWPFPAGTSLSAGQFRLVWLDNQPGQTSGADLHANFQAALINGSVVLTKVSGTATTIVDYLNYSLVNGDRSYGAFPDGAPAQRRVFYYATPAAANLNAWPAVPVAINEWMASNTRTIADPVNGKYSDWFELYNTGPAEADLSGYFLANSLTNKNQFRIPPGYKIPAGAFLLVWADNEASLDNTNDPCLHVNFKLSAAGETIAFFAPDGTMVDGVVFGAQTSDISQGRWPDGNAAPYCFMTTPTPGRGNTLGSAPNHPPTLAGIPDQTVYQGSTLTFTAAASDPDAGQTLSYSLDTGAPATASINPSSGVFTWTPAQADPPGAYLITVRAADNGAPPLSDAVTVKITVQSSPPLQVTGISVYADGAVNLTWTALPGRTYRVFFKTTLDQPAWTLLTELVASGAQQSLTDDMTTDSRRFYRIELVAP